VTSISDDFFEVGSEVAEPLFDKLSIDLAKQLFGADIKDVAGDTPGLKLLVFAGKLFNSGVHYWQALKLQAFLEAVQNGKAGLEDFKRLEEKKKQDLRAFLISELDKQTAEKQAEALGYLLVANLSGEIRDSLFQAVAHEIKNTNPAVFTSLHQTPFNRREIKAGIIIEGPLHYLPSSFTSSSNEMIQFASFSLLTDLGHVFFKYVYDPMAATLTEHQGE